jgi:hypothetical protein
MNRYTNLLIMVTLIGTFALVGCGKPYVITTAEERDFAIVNNIRMGDITADFPSDFDLGKMPSKEDIIRFQHLIMAELSEYERFNTLLNTSDSADFVITGSILDYSKGSKTAQFLIGFGAGAAKITTALRLVDVRTGKVVFAGNFTGKIADWTKENKEVFTKAAKNFAKALNKHVTGL